MKRSCLRVNFKRKVKYHSLLLLFFVKDEQHGQCEIPLLTVGASIFCGSEGGGGDKRRGAMVAVEPTSNDCHCK